MLCLSSLCMQPPTFVRCQLQFQYIHSAVKWPFLGIQILRGLICSPFSYYFNAPNKQCITFNYNGCSGNGNNFATLAACQNFCNAAGEPLMTVIWLVRCKTLKSVELKGVSLERQYTQIHTAKLSSNVILPYRRLVLLATLVAMTVWIREMSVVVGQLEVIAFPISIKSVKYICNHKICIQGVCPAGERVYTDVSTQQGRTCYPNVINSCPTSYLCRLNSNLNKFYCCAPPTTGEFPGNYQLILTFSVSVILFRCMY